MAQVANQPGEMVSFLPLGVERWIDVSYGTAQRPKSVLSKLAEMARRDLLQLGTLGVQARIDRRVGTLAVQSDAVVFAQYHRHSLPVVVEVQNAQQLVDFCSTHHFYRYRVRCPSLHSFSAISTTTTFSISNVYAIVHCTLSIDLLSLPNSSMHLVPGRVLPTLQIGTKFNRSSTRVKEMDTVHPIYQTLTICAPQ